MGGFDVAPSSIIASNSEAASISAKIMVIAMIVLFFVVAFCFFLSLYAKWYLSRNEDPSVVLWRRSVARQGPPAARTAPKRQGLDRATLDSLPVVVYDPKDLKEGLECSVCLSEISNGEKIRLLPKCNHGFHVVCIDTWFNSHSTCPLCRDSVRSSNQEVIEVDEHATSTTLSDSDSNSDSNSDSDSDVSRAHVVNLGEKSFPTNSVATTSSSSNNNNNGVVTQKDELVINIPSHLCNECSSTPGSTTGFGEEEAKTPVISRMKSLKRLLSRGKRAAPWASGSSSADLESSQSKPNNEIGTLPY